MNKDIRIRNTNAMIETLEEVNKKLEAQQKEIAGLNNTIGSLSMKLQELEQAIVIMKAMTAGSGPTV